MPAASAPRPTHRGARLRVEPLALACALFAFACGESRGEQGRAPETPPRDTPARACPDIAPIVARYECGKCHEGLPSPAYSRAESCVACHRDILDGTFEAPPVAIARWQTSIVSLVDVPSLANAQARLRVSFVRDFLREPYDVRPGLAATMPRLALTEDEIAALACALGGGDEAAPRGDASRGARLFDEKRCARCHAIGAQAAAPDASVSPAASRLAPDLALVRRRYRRAALVQWLRAPESLLPGTPMPAHELDETQAGDLVAFLLSADRPPTGSVHPRRLPVLTHPVRYEEVERRVFHRVCWHCHGEPAYALGIAGAGNSGGFGFRARGVNLATLEGVMSGRLVDGERVSLFAPTADGTPFLVAVLLARRSEEQGAPVPGMRGMPLGLPSLPLEEIQLVETWITQGRPP